MDAIKPRVVGSDPSILASLCMFQFCTIKGEKKNPEKLQAIQAAPKTLFLLSVRLQYCVLRVLVFFHFQVSSSSVHKPID